MYPVHQHMQYRHKKFEANRIRNGDFVPAMEAHVPISPTARKRRLDINHQQEEYHQFEGPSTSKRMRTTNDECEVLDLSRTGPAVIASTSTAYVEAQNSRPANEPKRMKCEVIDLTTKAAPAEDAEQEEIPSVVLSFIPQTTPAPAACSPRRQPNCTATAVSSSQKESNLELKVNPKTTLPSIPVPPCISSDLKLDIAQIHVKSEILDTAATSLTTTPKAEKPTPVPSPEVSPTKDETSDNKTKLHKDLSLVVKKELIEINAKLPKISEKAYEEICTFRANMVRQFPKKERSAKEQERRDKNTYACRRSRRMNKIYYTAIEEKYTKNLERQLQLAEMTVRSSAYCNILCQLTERAK